MGKNLGFLIQNIGTLNDISDRTGMNVSQVTDEVLYTGLIEMQEL